MHAFCVVFADWSSSLHPFSSTYFTGMGIRQHLCCARSEQEQDANSPCSSYWAVQAAMLGAAALSLMKLRVCRLLLHSLALVVFLRHWYIKRLLQCSLLA